MKTLILLTALIPSIGFAAVNLKSAGGTVSFLAVGKPSMLKIRGKAADPAAQLKVDGGILSGTATVEMARFETGIGLRDKHMKEKYLQVEQHPKAVLTITQAKVGPDFEKTLSTAGELPFEGKLGLHGKEGVVKGTFSAKDGAVTAKFPLTLSDYAIEIPSYLGVTVAENVDVEASLPLARE